ncbi:phosphoribosylformylglycinamidine cyclo-ligase [Carboxydothermus islandicus]|uniref:Phosphoribosylformylglycinamidine cyclo-ligase n=1 Tax=Carboxydothermus islandicus TaxID=661089 RepID=A0A1L8D4Z4_9THEO|nr:phosphoribosylformylglycinamidine cyclo-ligase [Carboxydothermus islandicus]GAV26240.1 phosphoribosylformylglycinamidine cyclo-ligase [Carboxydothermus islandicus]
MEELTYKAAGVDIDAGMDVVRRIKSEVEKTLNPNVLAGIGGFSALYRLDVTGYKEPVLVSSTDGVGTKLKIAQALGKYDTIGIDLVAMVVNDLLTVGAKPLFFLDYVAVGKLNPEQVADLVKGMAEGCLEADCALVGGETAEMPGVYHPGDFDIAGFGVGVVDKSKIIDGSSVKAGDFILGIASSGIHSNGLSLARKALLEYGKYHLTDYVEEFGKTLGEELLTPTRIYVKPVLNLMQRVEIKGMAHITGGGILDNLPRVLPEKVEARITVNWEIPKIFKLIEKAGNVPRREMWRTFNMGIGFILIVEEAKVQEAIKTFESFNYKAWVIGEITAGERRVIINE